MTTSTSIQPHELPTTVRDYLAAHLAHDTGMALRAFTSTAVVVDDGTTYRGPEEIRRFVTKAGAGFSYTTVLVGARKTDDAHWVATHRLEGDFPGGVVDLDYRFAMAGDLIAELVISVAPRDPQG